MRKLSLYVIVILLFFLQSCKPLADKYKPWFWVHSRDYNGNIVFENSNYNKNLEIQLEESQQCNNKVIVKDQYDLVIKYRFKIKATMEEPLDVAQCGSNLDLYRVRVFLRTVKQNLKYPTAAHHSQDWQWNEDTTEYKPNNECDLQVSNKNEMYEPYGLGFSDGVNKYCTFKNSRGWRFDEDSDGNGKKELRVFLRVGIQKDIISEEDYWGDADYEGPRYYYVQKEITLEYDPDYVGCNLPPTPTFSITNTPQNTKTPTITYTKTPTWDWSTNTPSNTYTKTKTPLPQTNTFTETPTGPTSTYTDTAEIATNTHTFTFTPTNTFTPEPTVVSTIVYEVENDPIKTSQRLKIFYQLPASPAVLQMRVEVKDAGGEIVYQNSLLPTAANVDNTWEWDFKDNEGNYLVPWEYTLRLFADGNICLNNEGNETSNIARINNSAMNVKSKDVSVTRNTVTYNILSDSSTRRNYEPSEGANGYLGGFKNSSTDTNLFYPCPIEKIGFEDISDKMIFDVKTPELAAGNNILYQDLNEYSEGVVGSYAVQQIQRMLNIVLTTERNLRNAGEFDYTRLGLNGWFGPNTSSALQIYLDNFLLPANLEDTDNILKHYINIIPVFTETITNSDRAYLAGKEIITKLYNEAKQYDNLYPYNELDQNNSLYHVINEFAADTTNIRRTGTHCLNDVTNESFQALIKAMLHQESIMIHMRSIGEISLSSTGARGYGQITSSVFNETRSPLNDFWIEAGGNERYIYKSKPNLECAARYLSLL